MVFRRPPGAGVGVDGSRDFLEKAGDFRVGVLKADLRGNLEDVGGVLGAWNRSCSPFGTSNGGRVCLARGRADALGVDGADRLVLSCDVDVRYSESASVFMG